MLETRATVIQIAAAGTARVSANQVSGCEQCNGKGCGSSKVAQLFCHQPRQFEVDNPIAAGVGDEVIVSVADGAVLRGVLLLYLLPLLMLIVGGSVGSVLADLPEHSDRDAVFGALFGLALGFIAAKWLSARGARRNSRPFIVRHVSR